MLKVGLTFFALSWGPKARSTWLRKLPLAYIVSEAWTGHLHAMLVLWIMQHLAMMFTTPLAMTYSYAAYDTFAKLQLTCIQHACC